mgnify:CR=1 FL=1
MQPSTIFFVLGLFLIFLAATIWSIRPINPELYTAAFKRLNIAGAGLLFVGTALYLQ